MTFGRMIITLNMLGLIGDYCGKIQEYSVILTTYESEDINIKSLFPKFQLIPVLRFQVMHDYVCFIAPIDYCVE